MHSGHTRASAQNGESTVDPTPNPEFTAQEARALLDKLGKQHVKILAKVCKALDD